MSSTSRVALDMAAALPSAAHDGGAPLVQCPLLMAPPPLRPPRLAHFELGGNLGQVAVRVTHHEKSIVARAVAPNAPHDGYAHSGHPVRPVPHCVPVRGFKGQMIVAGMVGMEDGDGVMFAVAAQKAGAQIAV